MIKAGAEILSPTLRKPFNIILNKGYFPVKWQIGYIVPIYKSDGQHDPNNYMGITITSCLVKLFSSIVSGRIVQFADSNNLIKFNQIGFQKGCRMADHVFVLKTLIESYKSKGKNSTFALLILRRHMIEFGRMDCFTS